LLPIARKSIALPLPSYSLKVIEKYIGFKRSLDKYGGNWAIAQYIEAVETEDESKRQAIMDKILTYNKEDLEATWAVFAWLQTKIS
jgi:predicted RecB family nuclease